MEGLFEGEELIQKLAASHTPLLQKVVERYGKSAVLVVEGAFCPGCRISISTSVLRRLHQEPISCEHCARLLIGSELEAKLLAS